MSAIGATTLGGGLGELVGLRWLNRHADEINKSIQRLATGLRINRAADDPAGAIAAEHLSAEQIVLEKKLQGLQLRDNRMAALDGGLSVVSDLLIDLQSVVVTGANTGGLTRGEREGLQIEADSILQSLDHVKQATVFDGEFLLKNEFSGQTGAVVVGEGDAAQSVGLDGLRRGGRLDVLSGDPEKAQQVVQNAIDAIATRRAAAGDVSRDLESQQRSLGVQLENVVGAKSAILDTDYAAEVGTLVRSQVLEKAAIFAVMAARKINAQNALALLGLKT